MSEPSKAPWQHHTVQQNNNKFIAVVGRQKQIQSLGNIHASSFLSSHPTFKLSLHAYMARPLYMENNKIMSREMCKTLVVCVKEVKQDMPEEWDETMPLPGDIIEGVAEEEIDELFMLPKGRSDLSSQLGRFNQQGDAIWVKIRRGDNSLKLRACVVQERVSRFQRRFTIRAATDDRHIAVLGDLTLDQCTELQEMSRKVVNADGRGFRKKEVKYDWKKKLGTYLPDQRSTVVCSILFMPLTNEHSMGPTTARSMAWFSAAVSSGAPLVFVNIQTEQIVTSEKTSSTRREMNWCRHQTFNTTIEIVQGIRLWFLPGFTEISIVLTPERGETRFGMNIKRTEEGFICIKSITEGSAAERAGLEHLHKQANETGHLVVISRLEGKSLMPSTVSSAGLIYCCDHADVKDTLASAIERMNEVHLYIMAWPSTREAPSPSTPRAITTVSTLKPPTHESSNLSLTTFGRTNSAQGLDLDSSGYFT